MTEKQITEELNQSIFSIFQSVKEIQEGTYAFMAGGLADDAEAEKAIKASRSVESKTEELRPVVPPASRGIWFLKLNL